MKLNFKKPLNDLEGNPLSLTNEDGIKIGDQLLSKNLGNVLVNSNTDDPVKYYDWGKDLYRNGYLEVDDSDRQKLYDFIKNDKRMVNLLKGQLLKLIDLQVRELEDATEKVNGILDNRDLDQVPKKTSKQK